MAQVCDPDAFSDIDPRNATHCEQCPAFLQYFMGNVDYLFIECMYQSPLYDKCKEMFKEVVTEEGACFVFNSYDVFRRNQSDVVEWTLEDGYSVNATEKHFTYPRKATRNAFNVGLAVYKHMNNALCKDGIQGLKVALHMPNEAPQMAKNFFLVPYNRLTAVMLTPKVTITDAEIREFSVEKRQCYFNEERYLRFFQNYTQNNCEIECLANLTVSKCGCQMFFMPSMSKVLIDNT
jgi:acid-sensing ion channel, other